MNISQHKQCIRLSCTREIRKWGKKFLWITTTLPLSCCGSRIRWGVLGLKVEEKSKMSVLSNKSVRRRIQYNSNINKVSLVQGRCLNIYKQLIASVVLNVFGVGAPFLFGAPWRKPWTCPTGWRQLSQGMNHGFLLRSFV